MSLMEELYLSGSFVGKEFDVGVFSGCVGLRKLDIHGCIWMNYGEVRLFGFNKLSKLEELNTGCCNFSEKCDISDLDELKVLTMNANFLEGKIDGLEELSVWGDKRCRENMGVKNLECPNLRRLNFCGGFDDKMLKESLGNLKCCDLDELNVGGCDISDEGIRYIVSDLVRFGRLRYLDLSQCDDISDEGVKELGKLKCLERLNLYQYGGGGGGGDGVTDEGVKWLRDLRLIELDLSMTKVTDVGLLELDGSRIRKLRLSGCEGVCGRGLGNFLGLEELDLSDCKFLADLELGKLVSLRKLHLNWSNVSDEGLMCLPVGLRVLSLVRRNDYEGLCWDVGIFLRLRELRELNVGCGGNINNAWLTRLANDLVNLEHLNLEYCSIENAELLERFVNLKELNLSGSDVTNEGLVGVGKMRNLRKLYLVGCEKISNESINYLMRLGVSVANTWDYDGTRVSRRFFY